MRLPSEIEQSDPVVNVGLFCNNRVIDPPEATGQLLPPCRCHTVVS